MPDPQAPAVAFYYIDDDEAMEYLVAFLIRSKEWFDVRRPANHEWSICFSAIVVPPKRIKTSLIAVEPLAADLSRNIAAARAKERANIKGRKR